MLCVSFFIFIDMLRIYEILCNFAVEIFSLFVLR